MSQVERPALRYYGSKWRLATWIIARFPEHHCYVEPFGGGASILLQKRPSEVEVYNDLNGAVVNFFRVLRERGDELIRAIELTPFARAEYELSYQSTDDDLEAARRFYVRSWQGRGGPTSPWRTGWRVQQRVDNQGDTVSAWNATEHLWSVVQRLKAVRIEGETATRVMERYDTKQTLFYLDPPYMHSTRGKWRNVEYGQCEMQDADHRLLAEQLHAIKGMAIISGYPSPLYDELYGDWHRVTCQTATDTHKAATECLWISPLAAKRGQQSSIFDLIERIA